MAESIQRPGGRRTVRFASALLALAVIGGGSTQLAAHDIPASVVVRAFAKPDGARLRLLVRVPLVAMRDFTFPTKGGVLLDLPRLDPLLSDAARTWLVPALAIFEDGRALGAPEIVAVRVALPSDRSFASYDEAVAHFRSPPLGPETDVPVSEALFDVMVEYPITSDRAPFSIDPQFARLGIRVVTTFRFLIPDQPERAFEFTGNPGLVRLDPRWHQAARRFVHAGFAHILDGIDHLLFLFCLVLPLRRFWQLVTVVTAFTVAHSITLFCAAFGMAPDALWFPPLIETLIAVSIVYMAIENIVIAARPASGGPLVPPALGRRWMIAFGFGLVHGFGFSFALRETLQFAGSHLVTSLVSFNVGVELGQLLVLAVLVPALSLVFRFVVEARIGVIIASALVAHTAWHWMTDRAVVLRQYDLSFSGPAGLAVLLRLLMVVVGVAGLLWLVRTLRR